jgi:alkaline phosphatase
MVTRPGRPAPCSGLRPWFNFLLAFAHDTGHRMTRLLKLGLLVAFASACATTPEAPAPAPAAPDSTAVDPGPFSVILLIGDGTGLNYWSAARMALPSLAIEAMPVVGLVGTESSNRRVTDSAAGATAFASGVKTYNGAIGVTPDTTEVETVLERAEARGKATGLVATSTITHATPAAFAAHVPSRNMHNAIAAQLAEADVEVMLGGGRVFFDPASRPDEVDLLERLRRKGTVVDSAAGLEGLDLSNVDRLYGFIAEQQPPAAARRAPALATLTGMALEILARDEDGFFLMVEGSQIDWRGHDNAPFSELIPELRDFNGAVAEALAFQEKRPNTLVIVLADHETGGLALHPDEMGVFRANYTTDGHTAGLVPLFARGPGAEAFAGIRENDAVGRLLLRLIQRDETLAP